MRWRPSLDPVAGRPADGKTRTIDRTTRGTQTSTMRPDTHDDSEEHSTSEHTADERSTEPQSTGTTGSAESAGDAALGRRGFLRRVAATAAAGTVGLAGLAESTGTASANVYTLSVSGRGDGPHDYSIQVSGGITHGQYANPGSPEPVDDDVYGGTTVDGNVVWDYGTDSYRYWGGVTAVTADGNLEFEFPAGVGFTGSKKRLVTVKPNGSDGRTTYRIECDEGSIDLGASADPSHDRDVGGPRSEYRHTGDAVEGVVWAGEDEYTYRFGQINRITVDGSAAFVLV